MEAGEIHSTVNVLHPSTQDSKEPYPHRNIHNIEIGRHSSLNINTVVNDQSTPTRSESYFLYLLYMEPNRLSLLHEQVTNRHFNRKTDNSDGVNDSDTVSSLSRPRCTWL